MSRRAGAAALLAGMLALAACSGGTRVGAGKAPSGPTAPWVHLPAQGGSPPTAGGGAGRGAGRGAGAVTNVYEHTGPGDVSPAAAAARSLVYVPNSEANTVDVIDPASFTVVEHFAVGKLPQHVTPSWDGKRLYVDNDLGDSLTAIDPTTGQAGETIPVTDPYNLYFTPDGTSAIVVAERLKRLDFRDPHTFALRRSLSVPFAGVDHLDFSADGSFLLVSAEFSGWVVKVDLGTMTVAGTLKVGGSPVDVKLSPDGSVFFVANQQRNGVSVVDPASMTELAFLPTGKGAHGLFISRDTKSLYVTNRLEGSVTVIDLATGRRTATWHPGGSPDMGGITVDGRQLWLSGRYHSEVYVIDTATGRLLHRIPVGRGAHGLSVVPQPGRFSLGHTGVYR